MNTTQPIKNAEELRKLKDFYRTGEPNMRNRLLVVLCLNTALRISDVLSLRWLQVYDFAEERIRAHLTLYEQKTGKKSCIYINKELSSALSDYRAELLRCNKPVSPGTFLFTGRKRRDQPITRVQAYRIIHDASVKCCLSAPISCHSLRKTFGHYALKQGASPAILMNIYNHSSFQVTKRYLGIDQDERDDVFRNIRL